MPLVAPVTSADRCLDSDMLSSLPDTSAVPSADSVAAGSRPGLDPASTRRLQAASSGVRAPARILGVRRRGPSATGRPPAGASTADPCPTPGGSRMPATAAPVQATPVSTEVYTLVQHFYARQMQALDANRFEEYAATFTEDGVFQHTPSAPPAVTRAGIVAELVRFNRRYDGDPVHRRHWFNHLVVDQLPDGTLKTTVYALVITTRPAARRSSSRAASSRTCSNSTATRCWPVPAPCRTTSCSDPPTAPGRSAASPER